MTRSTGLSGLIRLGSPPRRAIASRIAARSTTAGTPVRSCISTRAGWNAISRSEVLALSQAATALMSSTVTVRPFSKRTRFSSSTLSENGRRETEIIVGFAADLERAARLQRILSGDRHETPSLLFFANGAGRQRLLL